VSTRNVCAARARRSQPSLAASFSELASRLFGQAQFPAKSSRRFSPWSAYRWERFAGTSSPEIPFQKSLRPSTRSRGPRLLAGGPVRPEQARSERWVTATRARAARDERPAKRRGGRGREGQRGPAGTMIQSLRARSCQHRNTKRPPGRIADALLANAAAGSANNITPASRQVGQRIPAALGQGEHDPRTAAPNDDTAAV
jgi:hypothetical protein